MTGIAQEYADCAPLARETGRALKQIFSEAHSAASAMVSDIRHHPIPHSQLSTFLTRGEQERTIRGIPLQIPWFYRAPQVRNSSESLAFPDLVGSVGIPAQIRAPIRGGAP